ncbi:extracellular solute-binding protein family 1 [Paenibacillus curdlanolyticus YK9]|uniref:Extracellular solute-binding protein family 1 n=1 Tax=Paenibacillus curdlanolyticus YK9 TaxID=717606 RepID=E0IBH7_9BACL|nr:extracellular solute-binding protein [Paenibacillus curdlanolyticus]EFM10057.1 extracellular solute-binding protein family 1 [Paenibacillus curdlanolyticus YK9]
MKKLTAIAASVLLLSMLTAACGSSGEKDTATNTDKTNQNTTTTEATTTEQKDEPVTITVQGQKPDKKEAIEQLNLKINRFKAANANVTIKTDDWEYNPNEIGIKMAANNAPTEFTSYLTEGRTLAEHSWAADLTGLIGSWEHKDDLNPIMTKPVTVDGKIYGVPVDAYVMTITLNKKIFEEKGVPLPPLDWTWDELIDAAKKVNDPAKGIAGFIPMGKGNEAGWNWTNFLYAAGGDLQTVVDGKVTAAFNSEAGLKALELYKNLKDADVLPKNWALGYGDALNLFNQGRGAMVMCGSGNAADAAINTGGINKDDIVVYPIPSLTKGGKHTGVLGGSFKVINPKANEAEQKTAFNWITSEYYTDDFLNAIDSEITTRKNEGKIYIPQTIFYWKPESEFGKKFTDMLAKHDNVFQYDPTLMSLLEGKPEAEYEAQQTYAEIATVVQKVLTTKNLDLKKTLDDSANKIQSEVYNKIKVQK